MRGFLLLAGVAILSTQTALAQEHGADEKEERLDSVVVSASRAGEKTPVTFTMIHSEELKQSSPLNSLPMTLSLQPSVVSSSEGGTGLGYSKLTVRGSKGSQINVTLNGITLNDAESQEVFWVNIPALGGILSSVQLQRGLGTSASGAGAFGASINMSTASVGAQPSGWVDITRGAWNTKMTSFGASTGLLKSGLYANFVYSMNTTDGYIRNAFADSQSLLAVLGWMRGSNSLRFTYLLGQQRTGITWEGISQAKLAEDRTYNPAGEYYDSFGNVHYYDNETDNYLQQHFQLNYTHQFSSALSWTTTLNYTDGGGYYDQYKAGKKLTKYGLESPVVIDGVSYKKGDFITDKWAASDYYVLNSSLRYSKDALKVDAGVSGSLYDGDHYGDVKWCSLLGDMDHEWYRNRGLKKDFSAFARGEYSFTSSLTAYLDFQYRLVTLDMSGKDDEFSDLTYSTQWGFFNPRAGITFTPAEGHKAYLSAALGHREPGRSDIKEVIESNNAGVEKSELRPEKMLDVELGYEYKCSSFAAGVNLYAMEYWDMLLETGKLSSSGYAIKENVGRAWRRGVELTGAWKPCPVVALSGNFTVSDNRIREFHAYVSKYDNMDDWNLVGQLDEKYENVSILLSPALIGALSLNVNPFAYYAPLSEMQLSLQCKYVGKQYWDNTGSEDRSLPGYFVSDASLSHTLHFKAGNSLQLGVYVNNLFNAQYSANAWVSRYFFVAENTYSQDEGLFPQAPISCMLRAVYKF